MSSWRDRGHRRALSRARVIVALALIGTTFGTAPVRPAAADSFVPVAGAGSTWSQNAIDQWRRDVQQYGMRIDYAGTGSSDGRRQFLNGTVDFAASDIPFQFHPEDNSAPENPKPGSYAYMPVTAGGTVLMYNLTINGQRVTNLRLSGENITKIFTGAITTWNDPAIAADNPGLTLPGRKIVPVVRSDGSGSTAQFTMWMISQQPALWNAYCQKSGRAPACGQTSYYPTVSGMVAQSGDLGVAGYVAQSYAEGAIGYVNYSYALNANFPVAKMLNAAGYYTEPTPDNVAVSLLKAQINTDASSQDYLTQQLNGVYTDSDPRTYPLSSYSYMILPTLVQGQFSTDKGKTLGAFSYYAMCQGQQESASLGYSPMPINLVQASFDQIRKIPGVVVQNISIQSCNNPTFSSDGTNLLADHAPMPQACDKQGPTQCATGTGGAKSPTPVSPAAGGSAGSGGALVVAIGSAGGAGGSGSAGGPGGTKGTGGTATTSGRNTRAAGAAAAAASGAAANQQQCDPDTGACGTTGGDGSTSQQALASPQTLADKSGWHGTQTLMVLVAFLTLALVLAPGIAARVLKERAK
jgi:phosphate transport system substrate-binding protein